MNDCVIKETVLKVIESCRDEQRYDDVFEATLSVLWNAAIAKAYQAVSNLSSADVKPVVRAEWIDVGDFVQCSACKGTNLKKVKTYYGEVIWVKSNFCPNCGADMRKETKDE